MSDNGVEAFVQAAEHALRGEGDNVLSDQDIERVLSAAVRVYAQRAEETSEYPPPVSKDLVSATEVVTVASEMIRVVDVNLFDLSMWFRRPR